MGRAPARLSVDVPSYIDSTWDYTATLGRRRDRDVTLGAATKESTVPSPHLPLDSGPSSAPGNRVPERSRTRALSGILVTSRCAIALGHRTAKTVAYVPLGDTPNVA